MEDFWTWVGHSDNATHFKSAKQFHYWSKRRRGSNPYLACLCVSDLTHWPGAQGAPPRSTLAGQCSIRAMQRGCPGLESAVYPSSLLSQSLPEPLLVAWRKGPWDGLGAVVKTKVRTDIKNGTVKTKSGKIRSAREVAEHLHARFGSE
eukprot:2588911-Prymnesium_polylepis.1